MGTLHIYRGVPASGKTTAALAWVALDPENRVRVNRDDIRFMTFGKYWGVDENYVTKVQNDALVTAMRAGRDIVLDNTNLRSAHVREVMALAEKWGYGVEHRDFPITPSEAILRDSRRERSVGATVITMFFDRYMRKGKFPPFPDAPKAARFEPYTGVGDGPTAILVDVDGTLAHHEGIRDPYDTSKYHMDGSDETIGDLVWCWTSATGAKAIIMSGREEQFRDVLVQWLLHEYGWIEGRDYEAIYMRPTGDKRNDAVVKNELFEQHVAGKYNIDFVLDDRDRVVEMWRAKGLKCLQVAPGDF